MNESDVISVSVQSDCTLTSAPGSIPSNLVSCACVNSLVTEMVIVLLESSSSIVIPVPSVIMSAFRSYISSIVTRSSGVPRRFHSPRLLHQMAQILQHNHQSLGSILKRIIPMIGSSGLWSPVPAGRIIALSRILILC